MEAEAKCSDEKSPPAVYKWINQTLRVDLTDGRVIMRVKNHLHIRHILLYHFEKGWSVARSTHELDDVFGEGTISERQAQRWFKRFKSGDVGILVCTDSQPNLILVNSQEYWTAGKSAAPRCVGMVMIASRHIQKICHIVMNCNMTDEEGESTAQTA